MVSTDDKKNFPLLKAVFDNDLKQLSSLLSDNDADEKDQFGKVVFKPPIMAVLVFHIRP